MFVFKFNTGHACFFVFHDGNDRFNIIVYRINSSFCSIFLFGYVGEHGFDFGFNFIHINISNH